MKNEENARRLQLLHQKDYDMPYDWLAFHDDVVSDDVSWKNIIFQYSDNWLEYVLNSMSNALPAPDIMCRWQISGQHYCGLCGKDFVTLAHILAGCGWVRLEENKLHREDRYTWRHNCILQVLIIHIVPHIQLANTKQNTTSKHTHTVINPQKKSFARV